jgi:hypothetical protein
MSEPTACPVCFAAVLDSAQDRKAHDKWHDDLEKSIRAPRKPTSDEKPRPIPKD